MEVRVRLLGAPSVEAFGAPAVAPRGRKSWALLAYLVLADRPPTRQRLATLLHPDAEDPLGALRWSLADLRRTLRPHAEITGDPVRLELAPGVTTDVGEVAAGHRPGTTSYAVGELLEGLTFEGCPVFDAWLQVERRRLASAYQALLHEEALRHLGAGRYDEAVDVAEALVDLDPLEENVHTLLVRSLSAAGHRQAALDQVERCRRLFADELGMPPSAAVAAAAEGGPGSVTRSPALGRAAALAQLEAGRAAVNAGAVEAGLQCLRRAVTEAGAVPDPHLRLQSLIALGSALVHSVRGRDEEGAAVLHEALALAEAGGDRAAAARVSRELGFVDVQAGRRDLAEGWLSRAEDLAVDGEELSAVLGIRGMNLSDMARYAEALEVLPRSVESALSSGARRQAAWSVSMIGRIHLLRGDPDPAVVALDTSLDLVRSEQWMAFAPWPQALRAEVDRTRGLVDSATDRFGHAFALACQLGDPCWEGMAARGTGLVQADAGDAAAALGWLEDAESRCMRWPDPYLWIRAYILDATCSVAVAAHDPRAARWVDRLADVAARGSMREFVVRSYLHRAHLGQDGAAAAAAEAATDLENEHVRDLVSGL